jgi:hypothetical protein
VGLGYATAEGVYLSASRIDALLTCNGRVLRTSQPLRTRFGLAQVRRELEAGALRAVHVVFAPDAARPILLGLVRLHNASDEPLVVDHVETWEADGSDFRALPGACERRTPDGVRALADVSLVVRARAPESAPRAGLALEARVLLPPRSTRELHFAYAAPGPDDFPEALVRSFRGQVPGELARSVRAWRERLGETASPIEAYRLRAKKGP